MTTAGDEVQMVVDEARNDEPAAKIDPARLGGDRTVDRGDAVAAKDQTPAE